MSLVTIMSLLPPRHCIVTETNAQCRVTGLLHVTVMSLSFRYLCHCRVTSNQCRYRIVFSFLLCHCIFTVTVTPKSRYQHVTPSSQSCHTLVNVTSVYCQSYITIMSHSIRCHVTVMPLLCHCHFHVTFSSLPSLSSYC